MPRLSLSYPLSGPRCHGDFIPRRAAIGYSGQVAPPRSLVMRLAVAFALVACPAALAADADLIRNQKQTAEANCRTIQLAPAASAETSHFLVYSDSSVARLKGIAANLEKQFVTATKALQFE